MLLRSIMLACSTLIAQPLAASAQAPFSIDAFIRQHNESYGSAQNCPARIAVESIIGIRHVSANETHVYFSSSFWEGMLGTCRQNEWQISVCHGVAMPSGNHRWICRHEPFGLVRGFAMGR